MNRYHAFLILTIALIITYATAWIVPFLFTDDYSIYSDKLTDTIWKGSMHVTVAVGRPLHAVALYLGLSWISGFEDLRILRFIGIIGISVTSWIFYLFLKRSNWSTWQALSIAYIIGTLPSFEVYSAWAIAYPFPWACALAGCSVLIISSQVNKYVKYPLSVLLLLCSFLIHQPDATIYWAYAAITLLHNDETRNKIKHFISYIGVFASAAVLSLLMLKITTALIDAKYASSRTEFVHDIVAKISWFFKVPFVTSSNFHNLVVSPLFSVIVILVILAGLYLRFGYKKWYMIVIAVAIIPMSYAPNLIVNESWATYRTQAGLSSLMLLYIFLSLKEIFTRFKINTYTSKILLISAVVLSSLWATYNVTLGFVVPQYVELATIRTQIDETLLPKTKKIVVIGSTWQNGSAPFGAFDEFGFPSAATSWVPKNSVFIILNKIDPKYRDIPIEVVDTPDKVVRNDETIVIDTRKNEGIRKLYFK